MVQFRNSNSQMETETIQKNVASPKSQTSRRNFLRVTLTIVATLFVFNLFAQDFLLDPKKNERVIGTVTTTIIRKLPPNVSPNGTLSNNEVYSILLEKAQRMYPNKAIDLRNVSSTFGSSSTQGSDGLYPWEYYCSAKVIEFVPLEINTPEEPKIKKYEKPESLEAAIEKTLNKAMDNVHSGSRLAIDQISVTGGLDLDKKSINDHLIDILLDNGYKVVAKEYLEKLKDEQEEQASSKYNEKTKAKTDNLSGVGYFLNVRVTDKSVRIQVINVSTGEYEANATIEY